MAQYSATRNAKRKVVSTRGATVTKRFVARRWFPNASPANPAPIPTVTKSLRRCSAMAFFPTTKPPSPAYNVIVGRPSARRCQTRTNVPPIWGNCPTNASPTTPFKVAKEWNDFFLSCQMFFFFVFQMRPHICLKGSVYPSVGPSWCLLGFQQNRPNSQ